MPSLDDNPQLHSAIAAVRQAISRGEHQEADRSLRRAQAIAPDHPLVINESALRLAAAGDVDKARAMLERLVTQQPQFADGWISLALLRRGSNLNAEAIAALDQAIAIEPGNIFAILEKGAAQEALGDTRAAATTYFSALQKVPSDRVPPALRARFLHAQRAVDANNRALEAYIARDLSELRHQHEDTSLQRFDQCVDILLRKQRSFRQQPYFLYYPGMPTVEFHDRALFPWLNDLETATDDIRGELLDVLGDRKAGPLEPYLLDAPHQRAAAPGTGLWRSYPFWKEGVAYPEHMARCPRTMDAVMKCPIWDNPGVGPNAMFSILDPRTRIPPHTGPDNTRLVAHLPLIVPEGCRFRVGGETRQWRAGEGFVFDDTINHEAWNDSDEMRAVLIVDVWSPDVSEPERDLLRALSAKVCAYYGKLQEEPAPVTTRGPATEV